LAAPLPANANPDLANAGRSRSPLGAMTRRSTRELFQTIEPAGACSSNSQRHCRGPLFALVAAPPSNAERQANSGASDFATQKRRPTARSTTGHRRARKNRSTEQADRSNARAELIQSQAHDDGTLRSTLSAAHVAPRRRSLIRSRPATRPYPVLKMF